MKRTLSQADVTSQPHLVWNAFVDLLAMEDFDDLSAVQRPAHLVFWYDSEVQNGGHLQYFLNPAGGHVAEAIEALTELRLPQQAAILSRAVARWREKPRTQPADTEEYSAEALSEEFADCDADFHACSPTVLAALERYLASHMDDFISFTPAA